MLSKLKKVSPLLRTPVRRFLFSSSSDPITTKFLDNPKNLDTFKTEASPIFQNQKILADLELKFFETTSKTEKLDLLDKMIEHAETNLFFEEQTRYQNRKFKLQYNIDKYTAIILLLIAYPLCDYIYKNNFNKKKSSISKKNTFDDVKVNLQGHRRVYRRSKRTCRFLQKPRKIQRNRSKASKGNSSCRCSRCW